MPIFNIQLKIPEEYKFMINKFIEILAIAVIFVILMDSDPRASLIDKSIYLILGVAFHTLVVNKIIKIS